MDIPEHTELTTEEDDTIEITDLEMLAPAEKQQTSGLEHVMLTWQRSLNRRRFRLLTLFCILLLIALVIFANEQSGLAVLGSAGSNVTSFLVQHHLLPNNAPPTPLVIKPSVVILPQNDGFVCVMDTTWSPDSKYVVLLGDQQGCATGGSAMPGLLAIHDASTGKRVRSFLLNDLVMHAFHIQYPKLGTQAVFYYQLVLWSHDRHHIAILFNASFFREPQSPSFDGLLLLDMNSGSPNVLLHLDQHNFMSYLVWDTQLGTEYIAPSASSSTSQSPGYTIQPSPFYIWDYGEGADKLLPIEDNPGLFSKSSPNAIGDPDGGAAFTLWQPGQIGLTTGNGNGVFPPGIATWSTYFAAWSPDGRYIVDRLLVDGRFNIPGRPIPDDQILLTLDMDLLPLLPVRDKGLQRVLQIFATNPAQTSFSGASVSWRFDGRALAISGIDGTNNVNIYRCTDGNHVATLLPSSEGPAALGGSFVLRWSDDGSHVLLYNVSIGTVMIWNVPTTL
ncbi:MAG: hypothetical protein ABI406_05035 [Ktedonobacteraceae bacterium]